ncbi:chemosensory protein-related [Holotrichia oblita]|uniref:Chemosensory protein-related n=1 Tax=Holotrichia oblita TaxID=644536 RepID=A0ACB9TPD4_HOLOL|nr:chemosensory protein-related [Holotrichia oblita]
MIMLLYLLLSVILIVPISGGDEKYTTKYDNMDIEHILSNDRLLSKYVQCLLDLAPCTVDGLELKKNMPDALETNCSKCSDTQKVSSEKIISYLIDNRPDYWTPLQNKYDPTEEYTKKFIEAKKVKAKVST